MSEITYASVKNRKDHGLRVFDRGVGAEIKDVVEVDTEQGWLIKEKRDGSGRLVVQNGAIVRVKLTGNFIIRRPEECV